jgi:hypothetical protein
LNLSISRMTIENHHYSNESANILAISYYAANDDRTINKDNKSNSEYVSSGDKNNSNIDMHTVHSNIKELEIQMQFLEINEMNECKDILSIAINKQAEKNEKLIEIRIRSISSYLQKKLYVQVLCIFFYL